MSACYSRIDEIRLRIDKHEKGAVVALVSAALSEDDDKAGEGQWLELEELKESKGYQELASFSAQLEGCALTPRLYQRRQRVRLDMRAVFEDVDELNSILSCGAQIFEQPKVAFERHDGFLWNTYRVEFEITQRSPRCDAGENSDGGCMDRATFIPRSLTLTVPGRVERVENLSDLVGFTASHRAVDDDTVVVEVNQLPSDRYIAANNRYFAGRRESDRDDVVRLRIESREPNYNVNTLISVIGVIFGSGLLFQLSNRFLFRKRRPRPKPLRRWRPSATTLARRLSRLRRRGANPPTARRG